MLFSEMITAFTVISKVTWETCVMKTNLMHYSSSGDFVIQPLHVSGIYVAHHQEVDCIYTTVGTCCAQHVPIAYTQWC